jgi:hypothetical protein
MDSRIAPSGVRAKRRVMGSWLALALLMGCGDDGGDDDKKGMANPQIHAYCVAQCKHNDECGVEGLFEGEDCVAVCEGFTVAFGDCTPSQAVTDACIDAIEKTSCEDQKNDEEPEECEAICG